MPNNTNVLPNNLEAEQALLGCLLIDNETQAEILDKLSEEDFYQESHQLIIAAMKDAFNARKPVDVVTLADQLSTKQAGYHILQTLQKLRLPRQIINIILKSLNATV